MLIAAQKMQFFEHSAENKSAMKQDNKDKKGLYRQIVVLVIFLVGLAFRLVKLILDPLLLRDSITYLNQADNWLRTNDFFQSLNSEFPPIPVYTIKELAKLVYSTELAGRSLSLFLGSLIPVLAYFITLKLARKEYVALASAFLFVFNPKLIAYSIQPLRENHYLFFQSLVFLFMVDGIKSGRMIQWFMTGCFIVFAVYCRFEALENILILSFILFFMVLRKKLTIRKMSCELCSVMLGICVSFCVLLPTINYDVRFFSRLFRYKNDLIQKYDFENSVYDYSEISQ